MRCNAALSVAVALAAVQTAALDALERKVTQSTARPMIRPLRELASTPFTQNDWFAWIEPARCDSEGNLFFLVMPETKRGTTAAAAPRPTDILRVSADGKKSMLLKPGTASALADVERFQTVTTAVDPSGSVFALVWATDGDANTQHIVSFDKAGKLHSHLEVDPEEMFVGAFEVFGSGAVLLEGFRKPPDNEPRAVILTPGGGGLRDVTAVSSDPSIKVIPQVKTAAYTARGPDGIVYLVPGDEKAVYAVDASGDSRFQFTLPKPPRNRRLVGLKAASSRLAAVYYEDGGSGNQRGRFWIAVHDAAGGERLAVYGPVASPPVCYRYDGTAEQFTLLRDGRYLVTVSP